MAFLGFFGKKKKKQPDPIKEEKVEAPAPAPASEAEVQEPKSTEPVAVHNMEKQAEDILSQLNQMNADMDAASKPQRVENIDVSEKLAPEIEGVFAEESTPSTELGDTLGVDLKSMDDVPSALIEPDPLKPREKVVVVGNQIQISADLIINIFEASLLKASISELNNQYKSRPNYYFEFSKSDILSGFSMGKLELTLAEISGRISCNIFSDALGDRLQETISVPLGVLMPYVPVDWYKVTNQDDRMQQTVENMDDLFDKESFAAAAHQPEEEPEVINSVEITPQPSPLAEPVKPEMHQGIGTEDETKYPIDTQVEEEPQEEPEVEVAKEESVNQYESVEKEQTVEKTVTYSRDDLSSTEDSKDVEEELVNQYEETKESSGEIEQTVTYSRDDLVEATESKSGRITSPQVIDEQLYLPAEMVLELLNENDLVEPKDALLSKDLDFILEKQDILDGLKVGRISLSLRQVQSRFTSLVLNDTALDGASIQVPLAKFMVVIPKEWYMLSKKQDESKTKIVDGMSDLFTKEGIAAAAAEAKEEIKTEETIPTKNDPEEVAVKKESSLIKEDDTTKPVSEEIAPEEPVKRPTIPRPEETQTLQAREATLPRTGGPGINLKRDVSPFKTTGGSPSRLHDISNRHKNVETSKQKLRSSDKEINDLKTQAKDLFAGTDANESPSIKAPESQDIPEISLPSEKDDEEDTVVDMNLEAKEIVSQEPLAQEESVEVSSTDELEELSSEEVMADLIPDENLKEAQTGFSTENLLEAGRALLKGERQDIDRQVKNIGASNEDSAIIWRSNAPNGININRSGVDQLCLLNGVGPVMAEQIVDYRRKNGAFETLQDLRKITGLGKKTYEDMTLLSSRSDLGKAEKKLNDLLHLEDDSINLQQVAKSALNAFNLDAVFIANSDGMILAQGVEIDELAQFSDSLAAVSPQLFKRSKKALKQAMLPNCDMFTFFLGEHAVTFSGSDEIYAALVHKEDYPSQKNLKNSRKFVNELVWYCSHRAVL